MGGYAFGAFTDGLFKGIDARHGWEDRKDEKARQKRLDEIANAEERRAQEAHDARMGVYGRDAADWNDQKAREKRLRDAATTAADMTDAAAAPAAPPQTAADPLSASSTVPQNAVEGVAAGLGIDPRDMRRSRAAELMQRTMPAQSLGALPQPQQPMGPRRAEASASAPPPAESAPPTAPRQLDRRAQFEPPVYTPRIPLGAMGVGTSDVAKLIGPDIVGYGQGHIDPRLAQAAGIGPGAAAQPTPPAAAQAQARDQSGNPAHMNVGRLGRPVRYYGEDFIVTDSGDVYQGGRPVADQALSNAVRAMMDPETASIPTGAAPPIKNPLPMGVSPAGLGTRAAEAIRGKYQPAKDADALLKAGKITQQEHSMLTRGDMTAQDAVIRRMMDRNAGKTTPDLPMPAPKAAAASSAAPAPQASQGAARPANMPLGVAPSAPPSNIPIKAFAKPSDKAASATTAATLEQGASPAAKAATTTATQAMGVKPGQRTITDAQYQRGATAWSERYLEVGAPVYFEALVREGEFDKAKAFQEWMQTAETNRAMKDIGTSVTAFLLGDADKGAAHMVKAFNNLGYYPDGTTVEKSQFTKGKDGEINGLVITMKDGRSGHTFEQVFNGGVDDLVSSLLPAMMPEQAFEHVFAMRDAAQKSAMGAIERSDKLAKDQAEEDKSVLKAAQDLVKDSMGQITLEDAIDQVLSAKDKVSAAREAASGATWLYRPN